MHASDQTLPTANGLVLRLAIRYTLDSDSFVQEHQPQLISLLKSLCNTIEGLCLSDFDEMGADRLLNYLVQLLAPFCEAADPLSLTDCS